MAKGLNDLWQKLSQYDSLYRQPERGPGRRVTMSHNRMCIEQPVTGSKGQVMVTNLLKLLAIVVGGDVENVDELYSQSLSAAYRESRFRLFDYYLSNFLCFISSFRVKPSWI